jgi:hypothetical protein
MDQFVAYVTCIAAVGLFFATCALVWVTFHHAHSAEKMAAAADRLGEILDRHAEALTEANEVQALVSAAAVAGGPHYTEARTLVAELRKRDRDKKGK